MKMLHMHAISRDFVGRGLKRHEHCWSFKAEFSETSRWSSESYGIWDVHTLTW
jgi:hypothetical protein